MSSVKPAAASSICSKLPPVYYYELNFLSASYLIQFVFITFLFYSEMLEQYLLGLGAPESLVGFAALV